MKKYLYIYICAISLLLSPFLHAQPFGVESSFQLGTNIAIHPDYPALTQPSYTAEIAFLQRTEGKKIWSILHNKPSIAYTIAYQTLGNQKILGEAISIVPALDFNIFEYKRLSMQARIGWGLGLITKKYDSFDNPDNIVIGSHINACATVRAVFRYRVGKQFHILAGGGITHYSNGRFTIPNLGANVPFGQLGIQYTFRQPIVVDSISQAIIDKLPKLNQSFRPWVMLGLGVTEMGATRGPKYPVYSISAGVSRLMARISKLSIGVEYLYNNATFNFDKNNGGLALKHFNYSRFSVQATHELLFGHWGFVTTVGVYFNKHRFQRSIIVSKVGFNLYLNNYFKKMKHQLWVGCHIRAYAGEAEFVEFILGYNL